MTHDAVPGGRQAVTPRAAVVVGAGAVGSFLGATLAAAGWDVTLLGRRGGAGGSPAAIVVSGPGDRQTTIRVRRTGDSGAAPPSPDLVLLAVKMYDLEAALQTAARWPEAPLVTVQNGVGAEERARTARTSAVIALSLTTAVELSPGGVARRRIGGLGIAPVQGDTAALRRELGDAFADGGLPVAQCHDAAAMKWSKLLANLVGNATSALLDMDPGAVWRHRAGFDLERRQLREALAVMRAQRLPVVSLPGGEVGLLLLGLRLPAMVARPVIASAVARVRGGKDPSLRIRLREGGTDPTEIRWLNGAVAEAGRRHGVAAPVNTALASLVQQAAVDPVAADRWRGQPAALLAAAADWRGAP